LDLPNVFTSQNQHENVFCIKKLYIKSHLYIRGNFMLTAAALPSLELNRSPETCG